MTSQFQGHSFINRPEDPLYGFLIGDFGKEILEEYNSLVKSKYQDNKNLKVLDFSNNVVKGSNTYSIFPMNELLAKYGLRVMNPTDAQKIINRNENFLKGFFEDLGNVLRTEDLPNSYLARQLGKQARDRKYEFSNENPLVFTASDLELILDNNSDSGLGFKIKESASLFNALELNHENDNKKFNSTNEKGIPVFNENGNRTNYTRENGLSRFSLYTNLDLDSRNDNLALSNDYGRVVVVSDAKCVAPKI